MLLAFNATNTGGARHFFAVILYDGIPYATTDALGQWKVLASDGTTSSTTPSTWRSQYNFDDSTWTTVSKSFTSLSYFVTSDSGKVMTFVSREAGTCLQA
jgi:hypothetical protein